MSRSFKRLSITAVSVIVTLSMVSSAVLAAPVTLKDVPKDHWAYEAVNLLVEKGYMGVYEGGEFCGDDPVNRYLLAFVTAKLLRDVEAGRTSLSEEDMRIVKETSTVLREQLAVVTARLSEVESVADQGAADAAIAQEKTAEMMLNYARLEEAVEEQRKQLLAEIKKATGASDQKLTAVFGDLKKQNQETEARLGQEVAEILARTESVESLARATASSEAEARADLEIELMLAVEGERAAREAEYSDLAGQIDVLSLRLGKDAQARESLDSHLRERQEELESSLSLKVDSAIQAERAVRALELDKLTEKIESERKAREATDLANQEEARKILAEIASAGSDIADLDRKTAEADAAIMAALEVQQGRVSQLSSELADLRDDVKTLQGHTSEIEAELRESLDQTLADLSEAIRANSAEDLRTSGRVLENTMQIQELNRNLEAAIDRLDQNDIAVNEAQSSIGDMESAFADVETRLASIDKLLEGSVDELARRFSDELVAERWEAEMREVELQSMIEELEMRVEKLEGEKAESGAKKGSAGAALALLGVIAAVAAIAIGSGGK